MLGSSTKGELISGQVQDDAASGLRIEQRYDLNAYLGECGRADAGNMAPEFADGELVYIYRYNQ
jgi:hypothetical protein